MTFAVSVVLVACVERQPESPAMLAPAPRPDVEVGQAPEVTHRAPEPVDQSDPSVRDKLPIDRDPFTWRCSDTSGRDWEASAAEAEAWTDATHRATMTLFREGGGKDELSSDASGDSAGGVHFIPMSPAARDVIHACLVDEASRYPYMGGAIHLRVLTSDASVSEVCAGMDGAFDHAMLDCATHGLVRVQDRFEGTTSLHGWHKGVVRVVRRR